MGKAINSILNLKDNFSPKLKKVADNTKRFNSQLRSADVRANSMIGTFSKTVKTVGLAGAAFAGFAAVDSLSTFKDFEQVLANTASIAGIKNTSEEYAKLKQAARDAGKATTKTAEESAEALGYMALAGWNVDDAISGLMPILRLSEATGADLATTSDLVTDSMSALGLTVKELGGYLDIAALANNKSNQTATQLMEAYIGVGGTFKRFKTPLEESSALLGVLANRGIKGSEAGNGLSSTLINLTKKSGESAKALNELGISAYDAATGDFKGVTKVLEELNEKTKALTAEQRDNYLTMIGGKNNIATLDALMSGLNTTNAEGISELAALQKELQNANGALDTMAETINATMNGAFKRFGSALDDLKIELGDKLAPYITPMIDYFAARLPEAASKFGEALDSFIPAAIGWFEKLRDIFYAAKEHADILIPALSGVVGGMAGFVAVVKVTSFMSKLIKTGGQLTKVLKVLNLTMLANPFTWVAVAIGALVAAFVMAYMKSETFRNYVQALWSKLKEFGEGIRTGVIDKLRELGAWFSNEIKPKLDIFAGAVTDLWNNVLKPFAENWIIPIFAKNIASAFEFVKNTVNVTIEVIKGIVSGLITVLTGIIQFIAGIFVGDWKKVWEGVKNIFKGIVESFGAIFQGVLDGLLGKLRGFVNTLSQIPGKIAGLANVNISGSLNLPHMPNYATGTQYFKGGMARINERGGEIVSLPGGTKILPADKSERILSQKPDININVTIQGNMYGNEEAARLIGNIIYRDVKMAMGNV